MTGNIGEKLASDPDFMTSLARGLAVLRAFEQHNTLNTSQAAAATGLSRAAARRCLYTLNKLGYIGAGDGKSFALRPTLLPLARAFLNSKGFVETAQPVLLALRDQLGESCSLGLREGDDVVYVARAEATRIMSAALGVGSRLPAYCSSMGRVLLASLSPDALEDYLARAPFPRRTPETVVTAEALRAELEQVRGQGFSVIDEELEIGLRSIAVPVRDRTGQVVAALNVGAPAARISVDDLTRRVLPPLLSAATTIGLLA